MANNSPAIQLRQKGESLIVHSEFEPDIALEKDDSIVLALHRVIRNELKSSVEGSIFGGGSMKVFGVRLFGGSSQKRRKTKMTKMDNGSFILTDKKIIFMGDKETVQIPLRKVLQFEAFNDGLGVRRHDKKTVQYFQWNKETKVSFYGVEGIKDGTVMPLEGGHVKQIADGTLSAL